MDPVILDDDQLKQMTDAITANMIAAQAASQPPPVTPPAPKGEPPAPKGEPSQFSATDVATEVMKMLKTSQTQDDSKVYETLWNDKLSATINTVQGLEDFINGEDDYGNVRGDQLKKIEKYEDRVSALSKLTTSYKEASAGQANRRPIVNAKLDKQIEEANSNYKEVNDKLEKGEYDNPADFAKDYFASMSAEMDALM